jgi:hypothetical protein
MALNVQLGISNILDLSDVPVPGHACPDDFDDPIRVKKELGLTDVSDALFPLISPGARFWPFLLVARDLEGQGPWHVNARLKALRKAQPITRIGPGNHRMLQPYARMYRQIMASDKAAAEPLQAFLGSGRRKYHGDFGIFTYNGNDTTWTKMLVAAMGTSARQFASLLRRIDKEAATQATRARAVNTTEQAISEVLADKQQYYDATLWQGAACYAFLRCMYGIEVVERVRPHWRAEKWAQDLLAALGSSHRPRAACFKQYVGEIKEAVIGPPWKDTRKSLQAERRKVLSDLRFHTFYNLVIRPTPQRWE